MDLKQARTEANILANTRKVNHIITKNGNNYFVYIEKNFNGEVFEVVRPAENKSIEVKNDSKEVVIEVKEPIKKVKKNV